MNWIKENKLAAIIILLIILAIIGYFTNWFGLGKKKNGNGSDCKTSDGKDGKLDASGNCVATTAAGRVSNLTGNLLRQVESQLQTLPGASKMRIDNIMTKLKRNKMTSERTMANLSNYIKKLSQSGSPNEQPFEDFWGCLEGCQGWCDNYNYGECWSNY